jgi:transcription termination factor Rho
MESISGHLEIVENGVGYLRDIRRNFQPRPGDPLISAHLITHHRLPEGALVEGLVVDIASKTRKPRLATVDRINGMAPREFGELISLQERTSIDPTRRFQIARGSKDLTGRVLDLVVPMGRGQRGLIVSPPKAGKTTILKHMAASILAHHDDAAVFVLLVDERPEEVTDFKRDLAGAQVLFSSADQSIAQHMRITRLAMNTAIRCAETGQDAVVFIDSLTRMARAFNAETQSHGRTMSGGLGANALAIPRRIFGAARNIENGGSLTIVATILIDTGSRMDDIIFQEFKGTGNMDLVLSRKCAEHRVFPAVQVHKSGTRKEHLLLDKKELAKAVEVRRALSSKDEVAAMEALLEHLHRTRITI